MVLEDAAALLQGDLCRQHTQLCSQHLLEIADGVVSETLHAHALAQTVVHEHLDHGEGVEGDEVEWCVRRLAGYPYASALP